jgi:hypothetical protein
MTDDLDLRPRLDRLANELTRDALVPPPATAYRRGRRRRRRQLAAAGLLAIALVALTVWPGAGLLDRGRPTVPPVAPAPTPTTPAPKLQPLRPPHAAPGQSAVLIQDPPLGLPANMHTWLTECREVKFGHGGREFQIPSFQIERGDQRISWYVYPLGPIGSKRYKGPWANIQTWTEDPKNQRDPGSFPFVEVYGPQVRVHLSKPNGRKGSIVGPYSIIQGTTYKTLAKPTGAQVAIAWNCDAPPGVVPP